MSENIYTIPINEAFGRHEGCPLCRLESDLETNTLEYVMGAAMMEPDIRIETNRLGFCNRHFDKMLGMKNRLGLALILESHVDTLAGHFTKSPEKKSLFGKKSGSPPDNIVEASETCYVCKRVDDFMDKYYSNILHLWKTDAAFREKFKNQPFFCLTHCGGLLSHASSELGEKSRTELYETVMKIQRRRLETLSEQLGAFTKSFDHRNNGKEPGEERFAVEKTIEFLR